MVCVCSPAAVRAEPRLLSLRLQGSLEASLTASDPAQGPGLAAQVARLLRWCGSLRKNVHRNDHLSLLFAHTPPPTAAPSSAAGSELLALHYMGQQLRLRAYRFVGDDGIARYYTANGRRVEPRLLNPPVPRYVQITDVVQRRGRGGQRRHQGIDLKAPQGERVQSPFAGTVRRLNWGRRHNGRCIEVAYADGRLGRFLHLASVAPAVRPGATLAAGSLVGTVGSRGHSGAPHLHYEVWARGQAVEPLRASGHGQSKAQLGPRECRAFAAQRAAYDRALQGPLLPAWARDA